MQHWIPLGLPGGQLSESRPVCIPRQYHEGRNMIDHDLVERLRNGDCCVENNEDAAEHILCIGDALDSARELLSEAREAMLNLAPRIRDDRYGCFGTCQMDCCCTSCKIRRVLDE